MIRTKKSLDHKKIRRLVLLVFTLFILLGYSLQSVAGSAYYSLVMQANTTVSSPPVILQNGTAGTSTIYTNNTSAKVSVAAPVWLSGWGKRVKITIDHNDVDSALSDFPVLVHLSNSSSGRNNEDVSFIFSELQSDANRKKIALATSDGTTQCYVEIERWDDANEQAWLWVKVPNMSNTTDTDLYLYYDKNHVDNTAYVGDTGSTTAQNVWDSNFKGVWHLGETSGGTGAIQDSTSNNNDGTDNGSPTLNASGLIDSAISFDGIDDYINMSDSASLQFTSSLTIEGWINLDSFGSGSDVDIVLRKGEANPNDWQLAIHDQKLALMIEENDDAGLESSTNLTATTWYYLTGTWNGSIRRVYLNGSEDGSGSKTGSITPDLRDIYIGGRSSTDLSNGTIDEVRASNTTRSAAWIKASYESGRDDLLDFSSEEINIEDYVDNNTSEIGSPTDKGTHSNFTAQQYGPDSINDTLTEENTYALELWVDGFTAEEVLWQEVGATPYLNAVDYASNYIWATSTDSDYESKFNFSNSSNLGTINGVKVCLYAMNGAGGNDEIEVYLYNSTGGPYSIAQFAPTADSWGWHNYSCLSTLPTWTEVNNGQLRVRAEKILGSDNVYVDAALLFVNYSSSSYELDLEVQWTNVDFDETNEYLCIYGGTMSSENITVDTWNGSTWKNLFTDLSIGWNNVSVSSYLDSSAFTIRFKDGTNASDITQDSWNIDATILHTWTFIEATYDYVLRVNNTVTNSWEIRLKEYSNSSIGRLQNCTIYFHNSTDGTSSQIIIENGAYTNQTGPWYDLGSLETIYIAMTVNANSTGTSHVYTYLEIRTPGTSTYTQYIITFEIT